MIGVIGGNGNIGSKVVKFLVKKTNHQIKIGCRNIDKVQGAFKESERVIVEQMDCEDIESMECFIKNCKIVVNCMGPSHLVTPKFLDASERMGVHCIDLGLMKTGRDREEVNTISIHSAGMTQGLSGVLQRVILADIENIDSFEYLFGGISEFTQTAARDFLDGIIDGGNTPMAVYDKGQVVSAGTIEVDNGEFYDETTCFYPFFDEESEYIVNHHKIDKGYWCFAAEGIYLNRVIKKARYEAIADKDKTVDMICNSSKMDGEIYKNAVKFWIKIKYQHNGEECIKVLKLSAIEQSYLSALVVVRIVEGILQNKIKKGRYPLVDVNVPVFIYEGVCEDEGVYSYLANDDGINDNEDSEYGTI